MSTAEIIQKASIMLEKMEIHLDKNCAHCRALLLGLDFVENIDKAVGTEPPTEGTTDTTPNLVNEGDKET